MAEAAPPPGEWAPAILHVDMDSFFASVEVLDHPELAGRPVIVGGSGARGVVASCTYEARAFGVRSAMPSVRARQLCPHAVFVDGHYSRYSELSGQLLEVLRTATPLVEPIGLDEAFLDVTGARRLQGPPEVIAHRLRADVAARLSLDCSIGVGRSKLVAKLASRAAKPRASRSGTRPGRGVVVVPPDQELAFLHPLPVEALWGVGPATTARLHALGVRTVGELAALPEQTVLRRLGRSHGSHLIGLARGHDPAPVVPDRAAKSIGHEETFRHDEHDPAALARHAVRMAESVSEQARGAGLVGRTVSIKVRFPDFTTITRSHSAGSVVDTGAAVGAVALALLGAVDVSPGVRLLGVSLSGLEPAPTSRQMAFDLAEGPPAGHGTARTGATGTDAARVQEGWQDVTAAVDAVRARYGREALGSAAMVRPGGIEVPTRRQSPWGPAADPPPAPDGPDR